MSKAKPMGAERRCASYGKSHPGHSFTAAQRRRLDRKPSVLPFIEIDGED